MVETTVVSDNWQLTTGNSFRLIATDLDGTLMRRGQVVSERTREALRRAQERGAIVVLATARPPLTTQIIAERAGVNGYAICSNGAILYDIGRDEVLGHHPLDGEDVHLLILAIRAALPDVCFGLVQEREFACEPAYLALARAEDHGRLLEDLRVGEVIELLAVPTTKLIVRHPGHSPEEVLALMQGLSLNGFEVTHSGAPFVEVVAANITKAWGLASLCVTLGIEPEEVVAFGDAANDVAMLRWAGHGVAVANAYPAALEAADEVTLSNEDDGVAVVLERLFG